MERLKSRKTIESLFKGSKSFAVFPYRLLYSWKADASPLLHAGVSVSSKKFKKAVDRNRVKRLMREAYRLNKTGLELLVAEKQVSMDLFIIYTGKDILDFQEFCSKMKICLTRLTDTIYETGTPHT